MNYELADDPLKITKVIDPFGRCARFDYTAGQLTKITDPVGIQSQFAYGAGTDFINTLTTPYGPSTFVQGGDGTQVRWLEATDPSGGKERVEYNYSNGSVPSSEATAPPGTYNNALNSYNTFYWNKEAMNDAPGDYTQAQIFHWLPTTDGKLSGITHSEKKPRENRLWYIYAGQDDPSKVGSNALPLTVAQVVGDGSIRMSQFQYNSLGGVTEATDAVGRVTSYVYDTNNIDVLEVRQTTGSSNELLRKRTYNSQHEPLTATDAAGQPTTYRYDSYGQLLTVTNAKTETTTYAYGDGTSVPLGYLASVTSPQFGSSYAVTSFTYDSAHRIHTVTNSPDNYTITTAYDNIDRPVLITYPDGTTRQFDYTDAERGMTLDLTATKDRDDRWTTRHFNANRQMDSITDPLGQTTFYGWCTCGALTSITDPRGSSAGDPAHTTIFNRDIQSRVTSKVFSDNSAINYTYESTTSRLKSITDALGQITNYKYYPDDDIKRVSYANALNATPAVSYAYDPSYNRITSMTDGIGTTTYAYYPVGENATLGANQLYQVAGPFSNETITYTYDELGRALTQSINGVNSSVTYDSLGRLTTTTNALGAFNRTYDGVTPRLLTLSYPNGQTASYAYFDNHNDRRLQTISNLASDTSTLSEFDYAYDPEGQIQSLVGPSGPEQLIYDDARQLTGAAQGYGPGGPLGPIRNIGSQYDYDAAGNRVSSIASTAFGSYGTGYTTNNLNQLTSAYAFFGSNPPAQPPTGTPITYDANGSMTYDGNNQTFEWDAANRLVAINYIDSGNRTEFAYDGLGRRVEITEKGPGFAAIVQPADASYSTYTSASTTLPAGTYTLTLEGLNPNGGDNTAFVDAVELNGTLVPNGSFESPAIGYPGYQYNPSDSTWTFDANSGLSGNGTGFTSGNPDAPDPVQVAFLQFNSVISQTLTLAAGSYTLSFQAAQRGNYNASFQQLRVSLQQYSASTGVKTFIWCGNRLCEERDSTGSTVKKRFFAEGEQRIGGSDAGNYYYTRDHLGSIREVTASNGNLLTQLDYDAWGNEVVVSGNMSVDFGYTGHYLHQASGLNLSMYRAYNPTLGRWISRDQLENAEMSQGPNLYAYVRNDPINAVDPLGLTWQTNWNFFWSWVFGTGSNTRYYPNGSIESNEMQNSIPGSMLRRQFYKGGCQNFANGNYGTEDAYLDTIANPLTLDWSNTSAQVGGFAGATATNNVDGTVTFTIVNDAGANSFFLHAVPNMPDQIWIPFVGDVSPPFRTIHQTITWTEPIQQYRPPGT